VTTKIQTLAWALVPALLIVALAAPASAQSTYGRGQSTVSSSDIQRLQDQVYDAGNDVSRLRSRDSALADRLQNELDDVRDEVVYLKVKMRKEGSVSAADYSDVRTRLQDIRSQARGESSNRSGGSTWPTNSGSGTGSGSGSGAGSGSGSSAGVWRDPNNRQSGGTIESQAPDNRQSTRRGEIPAGQELDVRLDRELSSDTAQVEDRFTATTVADLYQGNDVLIPSGSTVRGVVSSVQKATRTQRKGSLTVAFDQITVRGRTYPIHGTVTQALESDGIKGEAAKIGAGSAVGAIIGGILGGAKGALLGVLIGGGGTIAATEGKDVTLPPDTILRVRLDEPVIVR
jgi:TolA-binding protein